MWIEKDSSYTKSAYSIPRETCRLYIPPNPPPVLEQPTRHPADSLPPSTTLKFSLKCDGNTLLLYRASSSPGRGPPPGPTLLFLGSTLPHPLPSLGPIAGHRAVEITERAKEHHQSRE